MTEASAIAPAREAPVRFIRDRAGAMALEYAIMGALVAVLAIGAFTLFATAATDVWEEVGREVGGALGGP
jgi:Flp pilus assembly pilin Flp